MGLSPRKGEVQQVTIEVPGPVRQDEWEDFKKAVEQTLQKYAKKTVKGKIVEIVYLSRKGKRVKPDGLRTAARKRKKTK